MSAQLANVTTDESEGELEKCVAVCGMLQVYLARTNTTETPDNITKDMIKLAAKIREIKKLILPTDRLKSLWLQRNRSLYKLLLAALLHANKEFKFFEGLALTEKGSKKIWENIEPPANEGSSDSDTFRDVSGGGTAQQEDTSNDHVVEMSSLSQDLTGGSIVTTTSRTGIVQLHEER
eukprot:sb/3471798/